MDEIDICIIGGGIIGLTLAYKLSEAGLTGAVLESGPYLGDETTGRNSGVLHAGLYYPTNSLKHLTCISGNEQWSTISKNLNIPINRCGKYVIASTIEETAQLEDLFQKANENQVRELRRLNQAEKKKLQKKAKVYDGFFSGTTGAIDVPAAVKSLRQHAERNGFYVLTNHKVHNLTICGETNGMVFELDSAKMRARMVINCAGHGSIQIRETLGLKDLTAYLVKGHYLKYTKKIDHDCLIYPLPRKDENGLGVHNVLMPDGTVTFGPDSEAVNQINYNFSPNALTRMTKDIEKTFNGINPSCLQQDFVGIRPKLIHGGKAHHDFWIKGPQHHNIAGYIELCGIDSPGITSAPAIADMVLAMIN